MRLSVILLFGLILFIGCTNTASNENQVIRVGYFPNITHAQPLVGLADGTFQKALGDFAIEPYTFNAGPAEIEALFAGQIDLAYIGPSPALNAYVQSFGNMKLEILNNFRKPVLSVNKLENILFLSCLILSGLRL